MLMSKQGISLCNTLLKTIPDDYLNKEGLKCRNVFGLFIDNAVKIFTTFCNAIWSPCKMTFEERAEKLNTDDRQYPDQGKASDSSCR